MERMLRALAPVVLLVTATAVAADSTATEVAELLREARIEAGSPELERRSDLDAVARARAEHVASLSHERRLSVKQPIADLLRDAAIERYRHATIHVDLQRGYAYPASAFFLNWQKYEQAWSTVMDPGYDGIGLATAKGEDGWLVLVAVLLADISIPTDLAQVERAVVDAVNEVRRGDGLAPLAPQSWLAEVARAHSEDMARRDYLEHESPEGLRAADRVREAGQPYRKLGENLYRGRGQEDPVQAAVLGWLDSPGHRKNILTARFRETGVGVAVDDQGMIYFTQLFVSQE